jgi:hypothetical protein
VDAPSDPTNDGNDGGGNDGGGDDGGGSTLGQLNAMILEVINTSASNLSQCKLIAVGAPACGDPGRYLVYSTASTDEARLNELVIEFDQLETKINKEQSLGSSCSVPNKPKRVLADGVCTEEGVGAFGPSAESNAFEPAVAAEPSDGGNGFEPYGSFTPLPSSASGLTSP